MLSSCTIFIPCLRKHSHYYIVYPEQQAKETILELAKGLESFTASLEHTIQKRFTIHDIDHGAHVRLLTARDNHTHQHRDLNQQAVCLTPLPSSVQ